MSWILKVGRELMQVLTGRYRPERHYMRGPGPKSKGRELAIDGKGRYSPGSAER